MIRNPITEKGFRVCLMALFFLNGVLISEGFPGSDPALKNSSKRCHTASTSCAGLKALTIRALHSLKFGKVTPTAPGGIDVIIDPATGEKTVINGLNLGGSFGPAEYEVEGEPRKRIVVTLPTQIRLSQSKDGLRVRDIHGIVAEGPSEFRGDQLRGRLGVDGKASIRIGGTLGIRTGRVSGKHQGQSTVFVEYAH